MSSWTPTTYKTKNWAAYNRALKQRGSLSLWFDAAMDGGQRLQLNGAVNKRIAKRPYKPAS